VPSPGEVAITTMTILALLCLAALTFSILAGVINGLLARRPRQRRPSPVLHPLTHHGRPRFRQPRSWRAPHHVGLFLGFLLATYVGLVFLRAVYRAVID